LIEPFFGLKDVMPVCSGGVHPALVPDLIKIGGIDIPIQAGGGVSGHLKGVREGARAMCEAVDATVNGVSLVEYAKDHEALQIAVDKWGV
jgi:ribulose-bisphosphate carboxylase large chain